MIIDRIVASLYIEHKIIKINNNCNNYNNNYNNNNNNNKNNYNNNNNNKPNHKVIANKANKHKQMIVKSVI